LQQIAAASQKAKPAALLQALRESAPAHLMAELAAELIGLDDAFEIENEFEGALKQLRESQGQRDLTEVLRIAQEQGLQVLTPEQKALLQRFRRGDTQSGE
jgi:hypothetical protein